MEPLFVYGDLPAPDRLLSQLPPSSFPDRRGRVAQLPDRPDSQGRRRLSAPRIAALLSKYAKILSRLFGLSFVPASAMAFDQAAARAAEPIHEQLRDKVRCADIIHADETHWRIDGKSAFIWFAGNPSFGLFLIDRSRASQVALDRGLVLIFR